MAFAIKAEVRDPRAKTLAFIAQKTMYGGKQIYRDCGRRTTQLMRDSLRRCVTRPPETNDTERTAMRYLRVLVPVFGGDHKAVVLEPNKPRDTYRHIDRSAFAVQLRMAKPT